MKQNLKKDSYKKNISGFRFVNTSNDKEDHKSLSRKGLTIMELIVVLGIMSVLASIGTVAYLYFFQVTGKLSVLHQIGAHALSRMQICSEESVLNTSSENLLPVDKSSPPDGDTTDPEDWKGCNSKARLNLTDCDECEEPEVAADGGSICMTMKNDKFSQCVGYSPKGGTYRFQVTVSRKVCVQARGLTTTACAADSDCAAGERCVSISGNNVCENPSGRSAVWPYVDCDDNTDCESGFNCLENLGECQTDGTDVNCA
ncbi:MAG: prepilin-type N-terminal cleavage/methylation domain-containing protein [Bdellovibrionales bacterium]|nr:prepilin-type N-terminal cleavage/methylation domain-containing protein [Bdellovibrionales bacterium]